MSTSTAPSELAPAQAEAGLDQLPARLRLGMLPGRLRLGTRRSPLARTQSQWVADQLSSTLATHGHQVEIELVDVTTRGDVSTASLSSLGGTGVFVSALRDALLAGKIDFAVHSLKDLPTAAAEGLLLAALPTREDPRDALIARDGLTLAQLPAGARVGTGSPRRAAQLRALGLGLEVVDVRGNVDTRLKLVADGVVDAVVLAMAGLLRLGRAGEVTEAFDPLVMLPAPGQGALAIECRSDDVALSTALGLLDDADTRAAVLAERSLLARLEAGCAAPVGALAEVVTGPDGDAQLILRAVAGSLDGAISIRRSATSETPKPVDGDPPVKPAELTDPPELPRFDNDVAAVLLGRTLAEQMLDDGAADLISVPLRPPIPATPAASGTAAMAREGDS